MTDAPFVLDLASNPHPRMLAEALELRAAARARRRCRWLRRAVAARSRWAGYRQALIAATGADPDDVDAWLDRHACST